MIIPIYLTYYIIPCILILFGKAFSIEEFIPQSIQQPPKTIIYAPWRGTYDKKIAITMSQETETPEAQKPCPLCDAHIYNKENLIVYKGEKNNIILTSQPYIHTGIHLLISPHEHIKELKNLPCTVRQEKDRL